MRERLRDLGGLGFRLQRYIFKDVSLDGFRNLGFWVAGSAWRSSGPRSNLSISIHAINVSRVDVEEIHSTLAIQLIMLCYVTLHIMGSCRSPICFLK